MSIGAIPDQNREPSDPQATDSDGVPVIDGSELCSSYDSGTLHQQEIVRQIRDACIRWGFFQLVNHGIPPEELRVLEQESKRLVFLQVRDLKTAVIS
jgi:isopenicillin N synthase-like dioxygenase